MNNINDYKRNVERADYACNFRKDAKETDQKSRDRNIVSHTSLAEVQAPESVKSMIDWNCGEAK